MTSYVARNGKPSPRTIDAYLQYGGPYPRSLSERVHFYKIYLQDVVPEGVTVLVHPLPRTLERHSVQLLTPTGSIFMLGLVGTETDHDLVRCATDIEASKRYQDGNFVRDWLTWRWFTCLTEIRFYSQEEDSRHGWECGGEFHLIRDARKVARYLQREFDSLRYE